MPNIKITDQVGVEVNAELDEDSAITKRLPAAQTRSLFPGS
jgi:hypothetical protein